MSRRLSDIAVLDLFAGPGGLGEGFSSYQDKGAHPFTVVMSVEKEPWAQQTLELRTFLRQFRGRDTPAEYAHFLRGKLSRAELFSAHPKLAEKALRHAALFELGEPNRRLLEERLDALDLDRDRTIVLGGPPCQAYSVAGRSRNGAKEGWSLETDSRSHLYREYLHVLAHVQPAAFVLENVRGLLSAQSDGQKLFAHIMADLHDPVRALGGRGTRRRYRLIPAVRPTADTRDNAEPELGLGSVAMPTPDDFIVRAEQHGVPQARHRVIVIGIAEDLADASVLQHGLVSDSQLATVRGAIGHLPELRSALSSGGNGQDRWLATLTSSLSAKWYRQLSSHMRSIIKDAVASAGAKMRNSSFVRVPLAIGPSTVLNHEARSHMAADLHRYLFAAAWTMAEDRSPTLAEFPVELLPDHANVKRALKVGLFNDRFRVQRWDAPATTIVSHIAKDGHYYIHPDPAQCRSLTVREAASLQTFPPDYFFCGPRTSQFHQVGNAVPVKLARQIAGLVARFL